MPNDMLLKLVAGVIPSAILGFLTILLLVARGRTATDDRPTRRLAWALPLVLFAVFAGLQPWIAGKFILMPRSASEWALPAAVIGLVFALINVALPAPGTLRHALRLALLVGIGALIARTFLSRWTPLETAAWLGAFAVLTFVSGRLLARATTAQRGVDGIGVLALFTMAAAAVCVPGLNSLPSAQFIGILAWQLTGAAAASLLRPSLRLHHASAGLPLLVAMSVVFAASLTSGDVPLWVKGVLGVLLPAIPGLAVVFDRVWPASAEGPMLKRSIARLAIAALPLLIIGGLGAWQAMQVFAPG
jgi:xanthosine utilization system XapX-like protein